jgi:hypothetical protein
LWAANRRALQGGPPAEVIGPASADRTLNDGIWKHEGSGQAVGELGPEVWKMIDLDLFSLTAEQESRPANGTETPAAPAVQSPQMQAAMFFVSKTQFTELRYYVLMGRSPRHRPALLGWMHSAH